MLWRRCPAQTQADLGQLQLRLAFRFSDEPPGVGRSYRQRKDLLLVSVLVFSSPPPPPCPRIESSVSKPTPPHTKGREQIMRNDNDSIPQCLLWEGTSTPAPAPDGTGTCGLKSLGSQEGHIG
jgi:hypothetical protein